MIFREDPEKQGHEQHSTYRYPFTDFPIISSNIQPHFVLLSLGLQLSMWDDDDVEELGYFTCGGIKYAFTDVRDFWVHMAQLPRGSQWKEDKSFYVPGEPLEAPYFSDEEPDEPDDTKKDKSYYGGASSKTADIRIDRQLRVRQVAKSQTSIPGEPRTPSKAGSKKSEGQLGQKPKKKEKEKSNTEREIRPLPGRRRVARTAAAGTSNGSEAVVGESSTTV